MKSPQKLINPRAPKGKNCLYCGKEFNVPNWRWGLAKYCSFDCYNKGRTSSKAYSKKRICKNCGREFLPTQWNQKYCGRECTYKARTRIGERVCPVCNKAFNQVRVKQVYCSSYCVQEAKRGPRPQIAFNKKSQKSKRVYLDNLWSEIVKLIAGHQCEYCHKKSGLNSHHIFSRSNYPLRWDLDNGVCLCALHHVLGAFSAHKAPLEFAEYMKKLRGIDWYNELLDRATEREIKKVDKEQVKLILEQTRDSYKINEMCGVAQRGTK